MGWVKGGQYTCKPISVYKRRWRMLRDVDFSHLEPRERNRMTQLRRRARLKLIAAGLLLALAGCIDAPHGDPRTWTAFQWQMQADAECISMVRHPPGTMVRCRFEAPDCTCEVDTWEPGEITPRTSPLRFNACVVLHRRGEL